jgi:hypothetical protein
MKTYGGVDVQIYVFFTSSIVGGEWSATRHGWLYSRVKSHLCRRLRGYDTSRKVVGSSTDEVTEIVQFT